MRRGRSLCLRLCAHVTDDGAEGWLLYEGARGMPVTEDGRHRRRVFLGKGHEYANSAGWQWLARFLVMDALGRRLGTHEHVHHRFGNRLQDELPALEVLIAELHGRIGAAAASLAGWRDDRGRFVEWGEEDDLAERCRPFAVPRYGPIVGDAALRLLSGRSRGGLDVAPPLPWFIPSPATPVDRLFLGPLAAENGVSGARPQDP